MRFLNRKFDELREIEFVSQYLRNADGSCMVSFGNTVVVCAATVENKVPFFLKGTGKGWISAEYSMLPCATSDRTERESVKGKQSGRSMEIQRLIGRSLRAAVDLNALGERNVKIDCDVIQADGGTRTAAISGACVALGIALKKLHLGNYPMKKLVSAISCGILNDGIMIDLDYKEDSSAIADCNFVILEGGNLVEVQASGENGHFDATQLQKMIELAQCKVEYIFELQKKALR